MLGGEKSDHVASARLVGEAAERVRDGRNEALVGLAQDPPELRGPAKSPVRTLPVLERPARHFLDEVRGERRVRRALCPRQNDHDRGAVLKAVIEQVASEGVVARAWSQLLHVLCFAHGAHASARPALQLRHQVWRYDSSKQQLLARKVLVQIAHGRARALGHVRHAGRGVAELCDRLRRRCDERLANMVFRDLSHDKRELYILF